MTLKRRLPDFVEIKPARKSRTLAVESGRGEILHDVGYALTSLKGRDPEFGENRTRTGSNELRPAAHSMATDQVLNISTQQNLKARMMLDW